MHRVNAPLFVDWGLCVSDQRADDERDGGGRMLAVRSPLEPLSLQKPVPYGVSIQRVHASDHAVRDRGSVGRPADAVPIDARARSDPRQRASRFVR